MKLTRKEKEARAKRFNISASTYYNWESTKPELIKIIELGLQKEIEIEQGLDNEKDLIKKFEELEKRMDSLENIKKVLEN